MRIFSVATVLVVVFLAGCATPTKTTTASDSPASTAPTIVTPDQALAGKVTSFNAGGRFVVLEFPVSHLPTVEQVLFVYRNGLKIGEVKVTKWQRDDHTVADLTTGEAQPGDVVRDQ
jgi:hypothetical protein